MSSPTAQRAPSTLDDATTESSLDEALAAKGPVLKKLAEAFMYVRASTRGNANALMPGSIKVTAEATDPTSVYNCGVHVGYVQSTQQLVLVWDMFTSDFGKLERARPVRPAWLQQLHPKAAVLDFFSDNFERIVRAQGGTAHGAPADVQGVLQAIDHNVQGTVPRRILCTGFCMGGALATLSVPWIALRFPTADIRCITFGAPRVGNDAFQTVLNWLCSLMYRCIYRSDPVPDKPKRLMQDKYKQLSGALYLHDSGIASGGKQAKQARRHAKDSNAMADHSVAKYVSAMAHGREGLAGLGGQGLVGLVDPNVAKQHKELAGFRGWLPAALRRTKSSPAADPATTTTVSKSVTSQKATTRTSSSAWDDEAPDAPAEGTRFAVHELFEHVQDDTGACGNPEWTHEERRDRAYGMFETLIENAVPELLEVPGPEETNNAQASPPAPLAPAQPASKAVQQEQLPSTGAGMDEYALQAMVTIQKMADGETPDGRKGSLSVIEHQERELLSVDPSKLEGVAKLVMAGKIRQAAVCATAAYLDAKGYSSVTGIANSVLLDDPVNDAKVHVGWLESGTAVFAFRGTDSRQDAAQDLKFSRRPLEFLPAQFPGAKAHLGFLQQFAAVTDANNPLLHLGETLARLNDGAPVTRVLCTGHSLGGALATLGAAWAALAYPDADIRCITFGSPRVGNRKFKRAFSTLVGTSYRVVYSADPVPSVPPAYRYTHVNNCLYMHKGEVRLADRPWHHILRPAITDHFMARYHAFIRSHLPTGMDPGAEKQIIDQQDTMPDGVAELFANRGCAGCGVMAF